MDNLEKSLKELRLKAKNNYNSLTTEDISAVILKYKLTKDDTEELLDRLSNYDILIDNGDSDENLVRMETEDVDIENSNYDATDSCNYGELPLLTPEAEIELSKRVHGDDPIDAKNALDKLVLANMGLVRLVAKRYANIPGMTYDDLMQEGCMGLIKAAKLYDWTRGTRFATMAIPWIRQAMGRSVQNDAKAIRIPIHAQEYLNKLDKLNESLTKELGRKPTKAELMTASGLPEEKVNLYLTSDFNTVSLETPVSADGSQGESMLSDFIEDKNNVSIEEQYERNEAKQSILKLINSDVFNDKERYTIINRFGFDGRVMSLEEIGKHLGITREAVRKIEQKTIRILKHPKYARELAEYLDKDPRTLPKINCSSKDVELSSYQAGKVN